MVVYHHVNSKNPQSTLFFGLACKQQSLLTTVPLYFSMSPCLVIVQSFYPGGWVLSHNTVCYWRFFQILLKNIVHLLFVLSHHGLPHWLQLLGGHDRWSVFVVDALMNYVWQIRSWSSVFAGSSLLWLRRHFWRYRTLQPFCICRGVHLMNWIFLGLKSPRWN